MSLAGAAIGVAVVAAASPRIALAQAGTPRFQVGAQMPVARSSQFERADLGFGGRFSWHPAPVVGIESEFNFYPDDFPDVVPFSRARVEGLFGVTAGPSLGAARPFARLRTGFLNVEAAPRPIACILIFPPPLSCTLAPGRTLLAVDVGGGVEVFATRRAFARVDLGDRMVKYPGPVFDTDRVRRDAAFFSHDFRFAAGAGLRF